MAIKYFKKTDNGAITLPTLKTYNNIEIGAITGPVRNDIQTLYKPRNHMRTLNEGHFNPTYFGDKEWTLVLQTSPEKYKLGIFKKFQNNGTPKKVATILVDAILAWFYVHKLRGVHYGDEIIPTRYTSLLTDKAIGVQVANGHSAGLIDMYTIKGIEGLSETDLMNEMPIDFYFTWRHIGNLSLDEAFEELLPILFDENMQLAIYDRQDEFAEKAENLGFRFPKVNKDGKLNTLTPFSTIPNGIHIMTYTVDAFYRNETFISYPLSNYTTITHDIDLIKYPLGYKGWFVKENADTATTGE